MKNIKIRLVVATVLTIIIVTLLLAMTVSIGGGDSSWKGLWNWDPGYEYTGGSGTYYGFRVSDTMAASYNNIYCIENGDRLGYRSDLTMSGYSGETNFYYVSAVVTITGEASGRGFVSYYDQSEDGRFWYGSEEGVDSGKSLNPGMHNRILASILNNYIDDNYDGKGIWIGDRKWSKLYVFTASTVSILERLG